MRPQPTDRYLVTPLYSIAEAAGILDTPATSLRNWAVGYSVKRVGAQHVLAAPLITTGPHGPEAVHRLNARVFALANANLSGTDAAGCFLGHEAPITRRRRVRPVRTSSRCPLPVYGDDD